LEPKIGTGTSTRPRTTRTVPESPASNAAAADARSRSGYSSGSISEVERREARSSAVTSTQVSLPGSTKRVTIDGSSAVSRCRRRRITAASVRSLATNSGVASRSVGGRLQKKSGSL
jgi:hypothetical protein